MYGGRNAPESYCKITTYLQHNVSTLYDNIQDLCLFNMFNTRGKQGVTFLLPDEKTLAKINKLVGTDARKAVAMINACTLPIYLSSISDFDANKDDVPNKLGNKLSIKSVGASSVILNNGAKITRDPKFKRLYPDANIAVFLIDGEVPVTGESTKALRKKRGLTRGGYTGGSDPIGTGFYGTPMGAWLVAYKSLKAHIKIYAESKVNTLNPLTNAELSLYQYALDGKINGLKEIIEKTSTGVVTDILFDGPLLTNEQRNTWLGTTRTYDNNTLVGNILENGMNKEYYNVLEANKKTIIDTMNGPTLCEMIVNLFEAQADRLNLSPEALAIFGDKNTFVQWWIVKCEFAYINAVNFAQSYPNNYPAIKQICHRYHNLYLPYLSSGVSGINNARFITSKTLGEMVRSKEHFCTMLSFLVNIVCCSGGMTGGVEGFKQIGAREVWGNKPNETTPTTFYHITSKLIVK